MARLITLSLLLLMTGLANAQGDFCFTRGNQAPLGHEGDVDLDDVDYLKVSRLSEASIRFWYSENVAIKGVCYISGNAKMKKDGTFIYKKLDPQETDKCIVNIRLSAQKASFSANEHCTEYCEHGSTSELELDAYSTCKSIEPTKTTNNQAPVVSP